MKRFHASTGMAAAVSRVTTKTPLFSTGLLDSLSILHLIAAIEEVTGRTVPDQLVVMKHFQSVEAMCAAFSQPQVNEHQA